MKRMIAMTACVALCAIFSGGAYMGYVEEEKAIERQQAASQMADAARVLGYREDSLIIREAQEHWWEAQESVEWHELTTEERIYNFFTDEMGLNHAAVVGILANLFVESSYDWTHDGANGYGLAQWCGGRQKAARAFAKAQGSELAGQLLFIKQELETTYLDILLVLRGVDNTAEGAYDAAYAFCMGYEIPLNAAQQARYRGALAKEMF